jgi:hypothetical protein
MQSRARFDKPCQATLPDQLLERLARSRVDVERDARSDPPARNHRRNHRGIAIAGIGRGSDIGLIDLLAFYLPYRHDISRTARQRNQGFQRGKVELLINVEYRIAAAGERAPILLSALCRKIPARLLIRRKDRRDSADFGAHVGNDVPVHRR